jgi:hypothetical protein
MDQSLVVGRWQTQAMPTQDFESIVSLSDDYCAGKASSGKLEQLA